MNKRILFFFLLLPAGLLLAAETPATEPKQTTALRISEAIRIDGNLEEESWQLAPAASNFIQTRPKPGKRETHPTQVRVLYDDIALYIGAVLYDHPDSILKQLDRRDHISNTDYFGVYLDTYHDKLNGYGFAVTAAGVQVDARYSSSGDDYSWNAVWESNVTINADNWTVEMKIPYSAIRFANKDAQTWGLNFRRQIRRTNEVYYWNPVDPSVRGFLNQFGELNGINQIESPLRLSLTPYLSGFYNSFPNPDNGGYLVSNGISGGADIKYGISEAFTLDMTLIPDFSQVPFDNQVLNLSPFEVRFSENRPFFMEGTELFNKGGFFYSRRIGGKPMHHAAAGDQLAEGEVIVNNPATARLLNATKISGRTKGGLGVGLFNAITGDTYATVRGEEGEERRILTQPLTNYSVAVLDQSLKNNSYVSFINTNATRKGGDYEANLTGALVRLVDRKNRFAFNGRAAVSQKYHSDNTVDLGYTHRFEIGKISGNWQYSFWNNVESDDYDPNDLGFISRNNEVSQQVRVNYNVFKPFWKFNNLYSGISVGYARLYRPFVYNDFYITGYTGTTFRNFHGADLYFRLEPIHTYDYFEPRVAGRFYTFPTNFMIGGSYNTDYRRQLAIDIGGSYRRFHENNRRSLSAEFSPRFRVNDRLSFRYNFNWNNRFDDVGYVNKLEDDTVIFGVRDLSTMTNSLNTSYIFSNRMSLTLRGRHYWSTAYYNRYALLNGNGRLDDYDYDLKNHNVNFNAFNVDMVFSWWFAPGSEVSLVWKNAITTSDEAITGNYFRNLEGVAQSPQSNSVSLKILYFLDALMLKNAKKSRRNAAPAI